MIKQATPDYIAIAAELLRVGELVAFPTDTVYGLGADARNDTAVRKIYRLKNRSPDKALGLLVPSIAHAAAIADFDTRAMTLAHALWPGALSIVLPVREEAGISPTALAGKKTVSLRMPNHPVILNLLQALDGPVAAPSANPSGQISPTTALDVARDLQDHVPVILAGGATPPIGIESTIIDLTGPLPVILRQGAIAIDTIENLIGPVTIAGNESASFTLKTPLRLNAVDVKQGEAFLGFGHTGYVGVEGIGFVRDMPEKLWRNLSPDSDLHAAARHLYPMLQELDQAGATAIAVMAIPDQGLGATINDRLKRVKTA